MRLTRFEVVGFKNLKRRVVLDDLAEFDVIHGENNVGKSNLLQAIDLFFWLLGSLAKRGMLADGTDEGESSAALISDDGAFGMRFHVSESIATQRGYVADDIFNFEEPAAIEMLAECKIEPDDCSRAGITLPAKTTFRLEMRCARSHRGCLDAELRVPDSDVTGAEWRAVRFFVSLLVNNFNVRTDVRAHGCILVDTHRRVAAIDVSEAHGELRRTIPRDLLLGLYDAKESVEPGLFQRWELFERAMNSLGSIVGDGHFVITYNRNHGRAYLAVQRGRLRTPIDSMGSGVQQIASLLARVLLANSAIVVLEEPELNLRYEMQIKLRDMLRNIVESGIGPRQIIVTSHSPAFEVGPTFFAMRMSDAGPVIERRSAEEAMAFLQVVGVQRPMDRGAYGYVSSDGLLRLSDDVRAKLGVEHGGGVVVLKRTGHEYVEILTNEQFMGLMRGEGEA